MAVEDAVLLASKNMTVAFTRGAPTATVPVSWDGELLEPEAVLELELLPPPPQAVKNDATQHIAKNFN